MLGITSTPVAPAAPGPVPAVTPNVAPKDIPAAPLTVTPGTAVPQPPAPTQNNQAVAPNNPQITQPVQQPSVQPAPQAFDRKTGISEGIARKSG